MYIYANEKVAKFELEELINKYINSENIILAYFYGDNCGPCKQAAMVLDQFKGIENVVIIKVHVDKNPNVAIKYAIRIIPNILFFVLRNDRLVVNQFVGGALDQTIKNVIDKYVDTDV